MRIRARALFSLAILSLLVLTSIICASEVSAGSWTLQSDLNDSDARALLGMLSFQPDASVENRWLISSTQLLLSDKDGNLQPNVSLFSTCASMSNCVSSTDLYRSEEGRVTRLGRLQPKTNSIFTPPRTNGAAETPSSFVNESNTPLASINSSFSIPAEWLWVVALLLVLVVTLTFLLRNRD